MNDNHRQLIIKRINELVHYTDFKTMINACLKKKVLTDVMADIIYKDGIDDMDRNRLLFMKLTHRGPKAFDRIIDILKENNFEEAYKILNASPIPAATFTSKDDVVMEDENRFLSIKGTTNKISSNSIPYAPPSPIDYSVDSDDKDSTTTFDGSNMTKIIKKKIKLEPYTAKTSFYDRDLEVKRAANFGSHPKLQVYNMKSKKRGVFFFVNIIKFVAGKADRTGAEQDRENLVTLFREMNYTVFYYEDLTRNEFFDLMRLLIKSDYLKNIDSFIFCIQTHGTLYKNHTIMDFSDGPTCSIEDVLQMFSNTNCESLAFKPKVFFFPFCRGSISDKEKHIKLHSIETDSGGFNLSVPSYSDILICYGTVPGFQTHRDTGFGSWYVRELCKIVADHACDTHIEDMLKMVGSKTMERRDEGRLQVASTENRGFYKLLYFNPKIFDFAN
ncbi:CLUMA_CG012460, isoform A [Clunio marinus]|uniref:CLUMA_CG012460, isoform A n=1 Tax=Clunio marinus TaxID=568069 RepID=A0A1J1IFE1_9DIPT|nr:CLUMA_CG012460, isoform A [Clunio marinus]